MWYILGYANTFICTPAHGGRAGTPGDRSPVRVRLYRPPLPNPPRQRRGPVAHDDCARPALHRSDRAQRFACVPPGRSRRAAAAIVTPPHLRHDLYPGSLRVPAGAVTPEPTDIRQADEPVDPRTGRRGQFCPGAHPRLVSDEAIRVALRRLRVSWKRAKHWITSPDPAYARKKNGVTS